MQAQHQYQSRPKRFRVKFNVPLYPHLDIVSLPGLLPEQKCRDTGHDTAKQAVEYPTLPHVFCCAVG